MRIKYPLLFISLFIIVSSIAFSQTTKPVKEKVIKESQTTPGGVAKKTAVVETSMGTFEFELYGNDAPKTVENFTKLAAKKFFDGMRVHRVAKGFVIQTGDEKSKDTAQVSQWGFGGESIWGKPFNDELNASTPSYKAGYVKGVVAMANSGPNTNKSQFFVCLKDVGLPHNYTIFGKVTKGMTVVEKIGDVEIIPAMGPSDGRPKVDVLIKKIRIK
ncbi:MAG: peptidylprolyl isomerase [Bacteroidota bacterium]